VLDTLKVSVPPAVKLAAVVRAASAKPRHLLAHTSVEQLSS
jgi:hypothetical protein